MLGRRDPQRQLFDSQNLPHRVPADSFYGRMAAVSDLLFNDDDLKGMYCPDNGRPSLPPSPRAMLLPTQPALASAPTPVATAPRSMPRREGLSASGRKA